MTKKTVHIIPHDPTDQEKAEIMEFFLNQNRGFLDGVEQERQRLVSEYAKRFIYGRDPKEGNEAQR